MWVAETQVLEPFSVAFPDRLEMMQLELQFVPIYGMLDAIAGCHSFSHQCDGPSSSINLVQTSAPLFP